MFGMVTIVFFGKDTNGDPLWESPTTWTFDEGEEGRKLAKKEFNWLKTLDHIIVPKNGLTMSTHKKSSTLSHKE